MIWDYVSLLVLALAFLLRRYGRRGGWWRPGPRHFLWAAAGLAVATSSLLTDHAVLDKIIDGGWWLLWVSDLIDWWRRGGRRKFAERLAGYKTRAIRARMARRAATA